MKRLDNDDSHPFYVFPAGSTISPGGYRVVDVGGSTGVFGLGQPDSARIYPTSVKNPIASQSAKLDGNPAAKGEVIDQFLQSLGSHTIVIATTDNTGNVTTQSVTFLVGATAASISASVDRLLAMGQSGMRELPTV